MFRTVATRGSYAALTAARPAMMVRPMRFASSSSSSSSSSNSWDATKGQAKAAASSGYEEAKREGSDLLGSIKKAGQEWAKDVGKNTEARHPYAQRDADQLKDKAQDGAQWAKEKAQEGAKWAQEKGQEGAQWAKNTAESASSSTGEVKEKAQEGAQWAKEKAQEGAKWAQEKGQELKEAVPSGETIIEKAKEFATKTYETVAPAASKAYESVIKPAAGKAYEFAKEQGSVLYEKGKETAASVGSTIIEKTKEAAGSVAGKAEDAAGKAENVVRDAKNKAEGYAQDAKQAASTTGTVVKEKLTPKDQDQPKTTIPGQARQTSHVEGERETKPFGENEAAQWEGSSYEQGASKDPKYQKTL